LLDVSGMVPLCSHHNSMVENHPAVAEEVGLSKPSGPSTKSVQYRERGK
jgi:hypothetical protein